MKRSGLVFVAVLGLAACGPSIEDRMAEVTVSELRAQLRDPGSLELIGTKIQLSDQWGAICGEYNAANGFGGMAGPQRFVRVFNHEELKIFRARDISEEVRSSRWRVTQSYFEMNERPNPNSPIERRPVGPWGLFIESESPIMTARYTNNHCLSDTKPITLQP